jgi:serine/threonine protein kinase
MTSFFTLSESRSRSITCIPGLLLGSVVGSGASGVVYSVNREQLAVKVFVKEELNLKTLLLARREITIMQKAKHENIVQLLSVFETFDIIAFSMELMIGGSV